MIGWLQDSLRTYLPGLFETDEEEEELAEDEGAATAAELADEAIAEAEAIQNVPEVQPPAPAQAAAIPAGPPTSFPMPPMTPPVASALPGGVPQMPTAQPTGPPMSFGPSIPMVPPQASFGIPPMAAAQGGPPPTGLMPTQIPRPQIPVPKRPVPGQQEPNLKAQYDQLRQEMDARTQQELDVLRDARALMMKRKNDELRTLRSMMNRAKTNRDREAYKDAQQLYWRASDKWEQVDLELIGKQTEIMRRNNEQIAQFQERLFRPPQYRPTPEELAVRTAGPRATAEGRIQLEGVRAGHKQSDRLLKYAIDLDLQGKDNEARMARSEFFATKREELLERRYALMAGENRRREDFQRFRVRFDALMDSESIQNYLTKMIEQMRKEGASTEQMALAIESELEKIANRVEEDIRRSSRAPAMPSGKVGMSDEDYDREIRRLVAEGKKDEARRLLQELKRRRAEREEPGE